MATLTLPNGTVLTKVSRASCLNRVAAIPLQSYEYSQARVEPSTNKRADCTGWVSYVWATPDTGPGIYLHAYNTASFVTQQAAKRIGWADLLPGDVIGYMSPTSPGNGGHAAIWLGGDRRPDGRFHVVDHGSGMGPKDRWVQWDGQSTGWLHPDHLAPWRYVAITEGDEFMGALSDDDQTAMKWRIEAIPSLRDPINLHVKGSDGKDRLEPNLLAQKLAAIEVRLDALEAGDAGGVDEVIDAVKVGVRQASAEAWGA